MSEFKTAEWAKKETDPQPPTDDVTRALPHAVGPEKSVLSTMLQDPQEYIDLAIANNITAEHFYLPNHSVLFEVLLELHSENKEIELVSLVQILLNAGKLASVGGPAYLTEIYTYSPSSGTFLQHLEHVKGKHVLRALVRAANTTVAEVFENPEDPDSVCDAAERAIMAIREARQDPNAKTIDDDIRELTKELEQELRGKAEPLGLMTGFEEFDRMTGGLKPAESIIIAARPSMGKTSFMMNVVENICLDQGKPTLVFSAEMSQKSIISRLAYSRAKFDIKLLSRGYIPKKQELQRIRQAFTDVRQSPLIIEDQSAPTIDQIRARARREKRKKGIELIAIDYLQLCRSFSKQAIGSREREIAEISAGIKGLAKDLGIPILILAQLNRDADKRGGKIKGKPQMSDLRESGSIEQDADVIGFLHRPSQYAEDDEEKEKLAGFAQLILAKNRNGPTGFVPLTFVETLMRFETGAPWTEEGEPENRKKASEQPKKDWFHGH